MPEIDVDTELQRFRERLLDLTARNSLLNFRKARRRSLQIVDELPNQVFEHLVSQGKHFYFLPKPDGSQRAPDSEDLHEELPEDPGDVDARERRHADANLQTNEEEDDLEAKLKTIRGEARRVIDETGANHLFLVLGLLRWYESRDSNEERRAPLILIPVALERSFDGRRRRYRYSVNHTGEELQSNLSLQKKLRDDFGLELPSYGDALPDDYFEEVAQAVGGESRWRVERQAIVGFFSFNKLLMYRDLDSRSWPEHAGPADHGVIRDIVAGREGEDGPLYADDYVVDGNDAIENLNLALDADSSQLSAVHDIALGKNLVIEGPPGTGKSQTITNVIAWALQQQKRVLFVAEKLAALGVVHRNLERVGLADLCLELHSRTARPVSVYEDLARRLNQRFGAPSRILQRRESLRGERCRLQDYLTASSKEVGPAGESVADVFWRVANLRAQGLGVLGTVNATISQSQIEENYALFDGVSRHAREIGAPQEHPWRGLRATGFWESSRDEVSAILHAMRGAADRLARLPRAFFEKSGRGWSIGVAAARSLTRNRLSVLAVDDVELIQPLCSFALKPGRTAAVRRFLSLLDEFHRATVASQLLAVRIPEDALAAATWIAETLPAAWRTCDIETTHVPRIEADLMTLAEALSGIREASDVLTEVGFDAPQTLADFAPVRRVLELLHDPLLADPSHLRPQFFLGTCAQLVERGENQAELLLADRRPLESQFILDDLPSDAQLDEIRRNLRVHGRSVLRVFKQEYRATRRQVYAVLRSGAQFDVGKTPRALKRVQEHRKMAAEFESDMALRDSLGPLFAGIDTDWPRIKRLVAIARGLQEERLDYEKSCRLLAALGEHESPPTSENVESKLQRFREAWTDAISRTPLADSAWTSHGERARLADIRKEVSVARSTTRDLLNRLRAFNLGSAPRSLPKVVEAASAFVRASEIRETVVADQHLRTTLGPVFHGVETEKPAIEATLKWIDGLSSLELPGPVLTWLTEEATAERALTVRQHLESTMREVRALDAELGRLGDYGSLHEEWLIGGAALADPAALSKRIRFLESRLDDLGPWGAFCRSLGRLEANDLGVFAEKLFAGDLSAADAKATYELTFFDCLAREALRSDPTLANFSRQEHEEARRRFRELDVELLKLNSEESAHRAGSVRVPGGVQTGRKRDLTQLGLIRNEIRKQRRHVRLRQLMSRAGGAVQALKPCFMMSPLSVAQYLPPGDIQFDLVLMDEASQIKPEDAVGAIARGTQLVVVGDPKQLPPTSFFDRLGDLEDEDEDATILEDAESILDVALKAFPRARRLRWHYRSQHESLIAFSNTRFYDGDLVVFPAATHAEGRLGVRFHSIDEGAFSKGRNLGEAEAIAAAIADHATTHPSESLGVGTFNAAQRDLIEECLERICLNDTVRRRAVERIQEQDDGLFIKNLENLQGDERDVIFVSYTYGPDSEVGRVFQRFGPITGANGWRRLNVLVTRARKRVEVFSSMRAEDILGGPDKSRGVNAMKDYLTYVREGRVVDRGIRTDRDPDSDFELAVARVVRAMGLEVVPQVGVSGYFVDLGVLRPERSDEFLLGIECDGATYHSAKSTRDRDRLREQVIRARGWELHRIWSTDWYTNQTAEERRLERRLRKLIQ